MANGSLLAARREGRSEMQTQQSDKKYILPSSTVKAMGTTLDRKKTYINTEVLLWRRDERALKERRDHEEITGALLLNALNYCYIQQTRGRFSFEWGDCSVGKQYIGGLLSIHFPFKHIHNYTFHWVSHIVSTFLISESFWFKVSEQNQGINCSRNETANKTKCCHKNRSQSELIIVYTSEC